MEATNKAIKEPAMNKRRAISLLFVLFAFLFAVGLIFYRLHSEPTYQGRTVDEWINDYVVYKPTNYQKAFQEMGTSALPYVVRNVARNDSWWHKKYAEWQPKLPTPLKKIFPPPTPLLKEVQIANMFGFIGTNSIPDGIALLKHPSPTVRRSVAWGLGGLRRKFPAAAQAIPALTETLKDPDPQVRWYAAYAMEAMGPEASNAVPALIRILEQTGTGDETNQFIYLRAVAACALGKIGPSAAGALPELKSTLLYTNSYINGQAASYLRGQAATAILRISADVDTALPVLLREMPGSIEDNKWDWIVALGEAGPRAKQAVPQLQAELKTDSQKWVLEHVTNALMKIDPSALRGTTNMMSAK